jgi:hypothetical protein
MSFESQNYETSREPLLGNGFVNTPIARQWLTSRHVIAPKDTHATIEELLERCFLCGKSRGYIYIARASCVSPRIESLESPEAAVKE